MSDVDAIIADLVHGPDQWSKEWAQNHPQALRSVTASFGLPNLQSWATLAKSAQELTVVLQQIGYDFDEYFACLAEASQHIKNRQLLARHRQRRNK